MKLVKVTVEYTVAIKEDDEIFCTDNNTLEFVNSKGKVIADSFVDYETISVENLTNERLEVFKR